MEPRGFHKRGGMPSGTITIHLRIEGTVQGVGYRDAMCREARRLEIAGWVRNRMDGAVEAIVQGTPEAVAAMLEWAGQGPPAACVRRVKTSSAAPEQAGPYLGFECLRSA